MHYDVTTALTPLSTASFFRLFGCSQWVLPLVTDAASHSASDDVLLLGRSISADDSAQL